MLSLLNLPRTRARQLFADAVVHLNDNRQHIIADRVLEREKDSRWTVELEEEPRVHTWGKTVEQALARVREAAALWFQTDEDDIELVPHPVLPKAAGRTNRGVSPCSVPSYY